MRARAATAAIRQGHRVISIFFMRCIRSHQVRTGNRPKTAKALGASASRAVLMSEGRNAEGPPMPRNRSVGHGLRDINAFVDPVARDRLTAMSPRTAAACAPRRARVEARRAAD